MNITLAAAALKAPDRSEQIARAKAATAAPDKAEVAADVAKARSSNAFSAPDFTRGQARVRVQQIIERLKVLKKLYANDPKGMAKALAAAFKELKAAVKDYAKAMGDEFGMAGGAVTAALAQGQDGASSNGGEGAGRDGAEPADAVQPDGRALYDAVNSELRKGLGEEGLQFMKEVRELANSLTDTLNSARTQMRARRPEKDMTEAFDDADRSVKELRDALGDLEHDIHVGAPMAGIRLSVAA